MKNNSFTKNLFAGIKTGFRSFHNPYREVNISWFKLKYYKHLPPGKTRTHYLLGKKFFFTNPAEFLHGLHEIFIDKLYKQKLPANPYIIDCGSNIGLSVIYMKQLYPQAHILAFEPDEKNFELLSRNLASFEYNDVELHNEAVWKENTVLQFSNQGATTSKIEQEHTGNTKEVKAIRLKDFLNKNVDFLKIDIEGAEFDVIKDIAGSLHYVSNLFIEYHGSFQQNNELLELLELVVRNGFSYYIKEASPVYQTPFYRDPYAGMPYDIQLNLFCFKSAGFI